jgi:hypothetical protein
MSSSRSLISPDVVVARLAHRESRRVSSSLQLYFQRNMTSRGPETEDTPPPRYAWFTPAGPHSPSADFAEDSNDDDSVGLPFTCHDCTCSVLGGECWKRQATRLESARGTRANLP